jgi:hypothetical protein
MELLMTDKPMYQYTDLDSVTRVCPCGSQITGEGETIGRWTQKHLEHSNGKMINECTDDGARCYSEKPAPYMVDLI